MVEKRKQDTQRTNALLEALLSSSLSNEEILAEVKGLVEDEVREDVHLEYKHGDVLNKDRSPARLMRRYVSGFANSGGGMLMVGIHAPEGDGGEWEVTGCKAPGGGGQANWASRSLSRIAGYLSPPAIPFEVKHPDGTMLIVAVARSPVLVPCTDGADGGLVYHLRMDDQTLVADQYLVADLILGRREHAYLEIDGVEAHTISRRVDDDGTYDWQFRLKFVVENQGLTQADRVEVGIVSMHHGEDVKMRPVSDHLRHHVDIGTQSARFADHPMVGLQLGGIPGLKAFTLGEALSNGVLSAPVSSRFGSYIPYEWKAAVYVIAQGTPPKWYQLTIEVDSALLQHLQSTDASTAGSPYLHIERLAAGRPVVGWVGPSI
jgi:hypothetical protein